jgi:phage terminase large subunit
MTWHPDHDNIWRARIERLKRIRADEAALPALKAYYADHPADFIEDWFITHDPRVKPSLMPFTLFPKQREFVEWLHARNLQREDGVCEKSRDMGISWLCLSYALHQMLLVPGVTIGFASLSEEKLDRLGVADSLFEKGRIILRNLPPEFLPQGFSVDEHCPHKKFINPENTSTIAGEAGNQIGRGGRATMYFKDESAFYERPGKIEAALSQTSDCKIDVSTSNGIGIPFHNKIAGGAYPVFRFHWRDDPRKDDAWYAKQKAKMEPADLAREIDIDHTASVEGICIPARWVRACVGRVLPRGASGVTGLDVGGGGDRSVAIARHGPVVTAVEAWGEGDTTRTAHRARAFAELHECTWLNFDSVGIGAGVASTFMHAGILGVAAKGVNTGEAPTEEIWPDDKKATEKFVNLKAELWWKLRDRCQKTWETAEGIREWPPELQISLPDDPLLLLQISQPKAEYASNGKIQIESKKDMAKRGLPSPDRADALVLTLFENQAGVPSAGANLSRPRVSGATLIEPTGSGAAKPQRRGSSGARTNQAQTTRRRNDHGF